MNKNQLLDMMNSIRDPYVLEAIESRDQTGRKPHLRVHRIGLLAAVIAALMLLAGCVAVYLRLQDLSIGKETYVQSFDEKGKAIEPTERIREVVDLATLMSSPVQKASAQWYEFTQSYDPDHALMTNDPDIPEILNNYEYIYRCYTTEMVDKLDEIAQANGVALLEARLPIQAWQTDIAMEALGRSSLLRDGADASMSTVQGMLYAPYNFRLLYSLTLTGKDAVWPDSVYVTETVQHSDYLPCDSIWSMDLNAYQQWSYTTQQGVTVLIAMNGTGQGLIVCPLKNGVLSVGIDGNQTGSLYPEPDQVPGKAAMEQFADAIDFSLVPVRMDPDVIQPKLDAIAEARQAGATEFVPPTYDGFSDYLMEQAKWFYSRNTQYAFYDLDGDGTEDLLWGKDGIIYQWLSWKDGVVVPNVTSWFRLCQGGMLEAFFQEDFSKDQMHTYYPLSDYLQGLGETNAFCLRYQDGQWGMYSSMDDFYLEENLQQLTEDEADAIRGKYPAVPLDWKPLRDYPLDETGKTLGEYLDSLEVPDRETLLERYAEYVQNLGSIWSHYRLLDINGDGVEELLLSADGDTFEVYVYSYGRIECLYGNCFLCKDGVLEIAELIHGEDFAVEMDEHVFRRLQEDFAEEILAYAAYNKATASWQSDRDGTPMDTAEAEAILAKYPRIDQGMRPISELLG